MTEQDKELRRLLQELRGWEDHFNMAYGAGSDLAAAMSVAADQVVYIRDKVKKMERVAV